MLAKLFSKGGLSLDRLRVFLEVAEAGGIAKAVGTDPVRQSQYSRQLKQLSEHYGVALIQSHGRTFRLSPAGERLARLIREAFSSLADFASQCADEPIRFSVGAGDSLIHWLLLPNLAALQHASPRLIIRVLNLRTQTIVSGLQEMSLDFGILRRDAVPKNLKSKPLGHMEYALYAPREMVPHGKEPSLAWALENLPIATQSSDGQFHQFLQDIGVTLGTQLNVVLECETFPHALCALQTGAYAAILPRLSARAMDTTKFVEITSPHFQSQRRPIVLAWNPRTLLLRDAGAQLCHGLAERCRF